jgi:antitoxin component of MazEF toxin-antitoxin module
MEKTLDFVATTRENGNSLIVTIPKNICDYFKIKKGKSVCLKITEEVKENTK